MELYIEIATSTVYTHTLTYTHIHTENVSSREIGRKI